MALSSIQNVGIRKRCPLRHISILRVLEHFRLKKSYNKIDKNYKDFELYQGQTVLILLNIYIYIYIYIYMDIC